MARRCPGDCGTLVMEALWSSRWALPRRSGKRRPRAPPPAGRAAPPPPRVPPHTLSVPSSEQVRAVVLSVGCHTPPVQLVTWPGEQRGGRRGRR